MKILLSLLMVLLAQKSFANLNNNGLADCEITLASAGDALPHFNENTSQFFEALQKVIDRSPVTSSIQGLNANAPVTKTRAKAILTDLLNPQSELSEAMASHIKDLRGASLDFFWGAYMKSYDKFVPFTEYLDLSLFANKVLPKKGHLAEFGAGSANHSGVLLNLEGERQVDVIDVSAQALDIAQKKLSLISPNFNTHVKNLTSDELGENIYDGGFISNVVYALGDKKQEALSKINASLKPGAVLILSDPLDNIQKDPQKLKDFVEALTLEAIHNHAPITEYDVAFLGAMNIQVLMSAQNIFLKSDDLRALAEASHFEVKGFYLGYKGAATYFILQKGL